MNYYLINEYLNYYGIFDNASNWTISPVPEGHDWERAKNDAVAQVCTKCSQRIICSCLGWKHLEWVCLTLTFKPINCNEAIMKKALE